MNELLWMLVKCKNADWSFCVFEIYSEFFHFRLPIIKLQIWNPVEVYSREPIRPKVRTLDFKDVILL